MNFFLEFVPNPGPRANCYQMPGPGGMQVRRSTFDVFAILVRENRSQLTAFVRGCVRDPAASDDIVQESFIAAWKSLDRYDETRPFNVWIRGIASNKILEHYRRTATGDRQLRLLSQRFIDCVADQHARLIAAEGDTFLDRLQPLKECLETLDAGLRSTIVHHYKDRLTCRAIAERLGEGTEAVKKRLQRARAVLKDCIQAKLAAE